MNNINTAYIDTTINFNRATLFVKILSVRMYAIAESSFAVGLFAHCKTCLLAHNNMVSFSLLPCFIVPVACKAKELKFITEIHVLNA